jgi:cobalt-zinc-cadmium efflux system outer membrane protein
VNAGPIYELAPPEMTVEQALLYALDNHPRLRARAHEVEVARADLITAGLLPNPQLVIDTDRPINEDGPFEISGRLMFTIPTAGKRWKAESAASAGITVARWAADEEAYLVLLETAEAALEVLYLQESVVLQEQLMKLAEEVVKIQRELIEARVVGSAQALSAEIDAVEIEFDRLNNQTLLEIARMRLSRALGLAHPQQMRIGGALQAQPLDPLPLDVLLAEAVRVRPDLARAESAIAQSRRQVRAAIASGVPDIEIGPLYSAELDGENESLGFRFGTDLPWFDRAQGDVYEAISQTRANEALRDEVRMMSLHDVADAYLQLRPIELGVNQYEQKILPLARRTEELLRDPEATRALGPVDIANEIRKLGQLRLKHLELRYQHTLIRTKLELLLGRRLCGGGAMPAVEVVPPVRLDAPNGVPTEAQPMDNGAPAEPRPMENEAAKRGGAGLRDGGTGRLQLGDVSPDGLQSVVSRAPTAAEVEANAAAFLDASHWAPEDKARGARFRR